MGKPQDWLLCNFFLFPNTGEELTGPPEMPEGQAQPCRSGRRMFVLSFLKFDGFSFLNYKIYIGKCTNPVYSSMNF